MSNLNTVTRYTEGNVDKPKHTWAGEKFCDCWKCSDKEQWAGKKLA